MNTVQNLDHNFFIEYLDTIKLYHVNDIFFIIYSSDQIVMNNFLNYSNHIFVIHLHSDKDVVGL